MTVHQWKAPISGLVKINTDGAFHAVTGQGAWGFICRNSNSKIQFAAAGSASALSEALQALHAETMALSRAVTFADELVLGMWSLRLIACFSKKLCPLINMIMRLWVYFSVR